MKQIVVILTFVLTACGGGGTVMPNYTPVYPSAPGIIKSGTPCITYWYNGIPVGPVESTPVVFNGQVLLITGNSHSGRADGSFRIDTFDCQTHIGTVPFAGHYVNAFVSGGRLYVFGSSINAIWMVSSSDLVTWTPMVNVLDAPAGFGFYNTSITAHSAGFLMAIEVTDPAKPGTFVTNFARSADLLTWAIGPETFSANVVANCPWIWFDGMHYYEAYLDIVNGQYVTLLARSTDLITWEMAKNPLMAAAQGEGNNNSDVAMVEFGGSVHIVYARGDQTAWLELATATFNGSLSQLMGEMFPPFPAP